MAIVTRKGSDGNTVYQVRVKGPAGWLPAETYDELPQAEKREALLKTQARRGAKRITDDARKTTLGEYWEVWSEENRREVSAGWKLSQDQMYRDYVEPVLSKLRMSEITPAHINSVLNRMDKKGRSPQTQEHVYSLLRKMFNDAVEDYLMLVESPVRKKHRPHVPKAKRAFLEPKDAFKLLETAKGTYLEAPVALQLLAALRVSEVQGLKWKHVMFHQDQLHIRAAFNNKTDQMQDHPKEGDDSYVPMIDRLRELLEPLRGEPENFVAPGPKGGMLSYETYYRAVIRLCKRAEVKRLSTHELRHSCTEIWVQGGATQEDLRRLLRHATVATTGDYIHRTGGRLQEIGLNVSRKLTLLEGGLTRAI